ncbi:MAG: spermidine/putrescine ABC transporter substrate-binding protein, partial [Gaiellaceae bacterium]
MSKTRKRYVRWAILAMLIGVLSFLAAGCGGDDDEATGGATTTAAETEGEEPESAMLQEIGAGEGRVDLIAWAGYVEDGSTDPKVDWVTGFEEETGCQVNVKIGNTSDEMVQLMRTGDYDA